MPIDWVGLTKFIWDRLKHLAVYILILLILVGGPYLLFKHGENRGAQIWADQHPQNLFSGPTTVVQNKLPNTIIAIGKLQLDWRSDTVPTGKVIKK